MKNLSFFLTSFLILSWSNADPKSGRKLKRKESKKKSTRRSKEQKGRSKKGKEAEESAPRTPPNVVIFIVDDLGYNQVGYHANPVGNHEIQTQSIDAHAQEGIILDRGYMTPWCGPSRAALQTGTTTAFNGNISNSMWSFDDDIGFSAGMPPGTNTIAKAFKAYGSDVLGVPYTTSYNGKWGIGGSAWTNTPLATGWDEFHGFWGDSIDSCDGFYPILATSPHTGRDERFGGLLSSALPGFWHQSASKDVQSDLCDYFTSLPSDELSDEEKYVACMSEPTTVSEKLFDLDILEKTVKTISTHDYDAGPLLHVHSMQMMHLPMHYPKQYDEESHLEDLPEYFKEGHVKPNATNEDLRRSTANAVRFVNDVFDEVVQSIKNAGQWDNTIVLFTSDNGGAMYLGSANNNYPLRGAKFGPFEGGLRVPQFLTGGWIDQNTPKDRTTISKTYMFPLDWGPTLLEMAGGDIGYLVNKVGPRYGTAMWEYIRASVSPDSDTVLHQKEQMVSYSADILFDVQMDKAYKMLYFGDNPVQVPRHWSPLYSSNEDMMPNIASYSVKPCRFEGVAEDCCLLDIESDPSENSPIRTNCDLRREEASLLFHDPEVCNGTPQMCLEPGSMQNDFIFPQDLTLWSQYGAVGPFANSQGQPIV